MSVDRTVTVAGSTHFHIIQILRIALLYVRFGSDHQLLCHGEQQG